MRTLDEKLTLKIVQLLTSAECSAEYLAGKLGTNKRRIYRYLNVVGQTHMLARRKRGGVFAYSISAPQKARPLRA